MPINSNKLTDGLLVIACLLGVCLRWLVSLFSYSGQGKKQMFGDYEAQRHWMEITYNLPPNEWYFNSSQNDLMYWGLDYPPLTAYHSFLCGYIANLINPGWVQLETSRGFESYHHKLFMRYSVLTSDIVIFFSAVVIYWYWSSTLKHGKACAVAATLLYPGLILIDHGHFQYNCISLGLLIWAIAAICKGHNLWASFLFSLAINYKQMELYHAIPFFCYLLGTCLEEGSWKSGVIKLLKISSVVLATFCLCWLPFLTSYESAYQVVKRLFPLDRGLFEDKVANFWCSLSIVVKFKSLMTQSTLSLMTLIVTLASVLPLSLNLLRNPNVHTFKLSLVNCSLVFFLFSYQVHEKSILLAAIPVALLLPEYPLACFWFLLISVYSLFPLIVKDNLVLPCISTCVLYYTIVGKAYVASAWKNLGNEKKIVKFTFFSSLIGAVIQAILALSISPPAKYPDLHVLINIEYCFVHFVLFTLYFHHLQLRTSPIAYNKIKMN